CATTGVGDTTRRSATTKQRRRLDMCGPFVGRGIVWPRSVIIRGDIVIEVLGAIGNAGSIDSKQEEHITETLHGREDPEVRDLSMRKTVARDHDKDEPG